MRRLTDSLVTARSVAAAIHAVRGRRAGVVQDRLRTLVAALSGPAVPAAPPTPRGGPSESTTSELVAQLADLLADGDRGRVWLALAVVHAELPVAEEVLAGARAIVLDGPLPYLARLLAPVRNPLFRSHRDLSQVDVVTGVVVVDVEHTSHTWLATGIQRVARQSVVRWDADHDVTLVAWSYDGRAIRPLAAPEREIALRGGGAQGKPPRPNEDRLIVPWQATYVLPELATEPTRTARILALAEFSGCRTGVIGFDCVPLSSGETIGGAMGSAFANNLAAVRHMDRVATISHAAAQEYRGWRDMLVGLGIRGPQIEVIQLPVEAQATSDEALARARERLLTDAMPLVLCVGSHEPRKNHLAVLHAADLAWRAGQTFNLVFVGGNSWSNDGFADRLAELQAAGRPVESISALSDDLLWAAYRLARCVVFPSLNEGFGLPIAEALSTGTPVVTSNFGSMREVAAHGGALLVDPRDERELASAIVRLLEDDALHAELVAQTRSMPTRTWDEYASEVWDYLVAGNSPPPPATPPDPT